MRLCGGCVLFCSCGTVDGYLEWDVTRSLTLLNADTERRAVSSKSISFAEEFGEKLVFLEIMHLFYN